jgi:uncharacterized protein YjbI with pentapeptide repeats
MRKFQLLIFLFSVFVLFVSHLSIHVVARNHSDFAQHDYDRALRGEKNLAGAKLDRASFKGMDLRGVDFRDAELDVANFENADLSGANFTDADLEDANLKGAKLTGAIFKDAELEFATWSNGRICAEGSIGGCW